MERKRFFKLAILTLFIILTLSNCNDAQAQSGTVKPIFLKDLQGNMVNLENYIGKETTIIWITDMCPVCAEGADNFNQVYEKLSLKIKFIIISTTGEKRTKAFIDKYEIKAKVLMGGEDNLTKQLSGETGKGICPVKNIFIISRKGELKFSSHLPGITSRDLENLATQTDSGN